MSNKIIEVEIRGALTEDSYINLTAYLKDNAVLIKKQNRFLLDYSTFLEGIGERKTDVRVRKTNGKVEIIVKKGKFGGTSREEVSVFPEGDSFESTLRLMNMLGYSKAVACDRSITRYKIEDIEIAIQDVIDFSDSRNIHSRFFEAEIMCNDDEKEKEKAVEKIRTFLSKHKLIEFSEQEWNDYVFKMNKEANGVFDYQTDNIDKIINLGV